MKFKREKFLAFSSSICDDEKKKIQTKNFLPLVQIFLCWSLINERKTTIFVYWNVAKKSFAPFSVNKPGRKKKTTYFFSVFFFLKKKIKDFLISSSKILRAQSEKNNEIGSHNCKATKTNQMPI